MDVPSSPALRGLLDELYAFGDANDTEVAERSRKMLNISRATGQLLWVLARATGARRLLEVGTSNGVSALWLADGAGEAARTVTVEQDPWKASLARATFERAGLEHRILCEVGDAGDVLRRLDPPFDLVLLDADRTRYMAWWPDVRRLLRPGGLLAVDNAVSHAQETEPLRAALESDPVFAVTRVADGKGLLIALRSTLAPAGG